MGATRTMARRIVHARAARHAAQARVLDPEKIRAPGKFRRWLFKEDWAKYQKEARK